MSDNKTLRKSYNAEKWVILTNLDGVNKYVSQKFGRKHEYPYTVLLNKARRFDEKHLAERFVEVNGIVGCKVIPVKYSLTVSL